MHAVFCIALRLLWFSHLNESFSDCLPRLGKGESRQFAIDYLLLVFRPESFSSFSSRSTLVAIVDYGTPWGLPYNIFPFEPVMFLLTKQFVEFHRSPSIHPFYFRYRYGYCSFVSGYKSKK